MNFEPQTEDEKLQALRSLATAEDEAADDSEGIPSNPFGSAFGAAAASGLREKEPASPVEVGEFKSRALADTATPEAAGAEATMSYPAELWSKPVQGPELPPDDEPERDELDYFADVDKLSTPEATADFKAAGDNALAKLDAQKSAPASASSSGFSAQMLQQLLGAAPSDGADDIAALKKAQAADKQQYWNSRLSDAIAAWVQRKPLGAEAPPSEAANVMAQLQLQKQRRDEQARYADAARRLMGRGDDASLIQRRKDLSEEARLRLEFQKRQLDALNEDRKNRRGTDIDRLELDRLKAEEIARANRERERLRAEELKAKPKRGGPAPFVAIKEGDLAAVPEADRPIVKSMLDGRTMPKEIPIKSRERILKMVLQVNPQYDPAKAEAYRAVSKQQALAPDVVAMDVGRHHLDAAKKLIPDNADAQFLNKLKQAYASGSGDPQFAAFNTAANVAAHEVARMMKIDDQAGKQMVEHMMAPVQSKAQLLKVFETIDELIAGKQEGLSRQLGRYAPTDFGAPPKPPEAAHGEAPAAAPQTKKGNDGKLYRKNANGKWERVDG